MYYITRNLVDVGEQLPAEVREAGLTYKQLSLFDDFHVTAPSRPVDGMKALTGQL